ncbi:MAG: hypothetical protein C0501_21245 [Isosphaera sp.]|nr:hypothetical protein [Isosphaera sp.]
MQPPPGPRKQRTRQHVIADQSVNHVERYVIDAGHTAQRLGADYGYDLVMQTYDPDGYTEPGLIYFQLKASEALARSGNDFAFDLDVRDYNLWKVEPFPVILVLFDAAARRAYWVHVQDYFAGGRFRRPKKGAKTVRVRVPRGQVVGRRAVAAWRRSKAGVAVRLV